MKNNFNEFLPNEAENLNQENLLENNNTPAVEEQEFSSLDGEDPKKPKTKNTKNSVNTTSTPDPLSSIGKFVQGQVESGQPKPIKINLEEYAPYFGNNLGYVSDKDTETLNHFRAIKQGKVEEFKNASSRVLLNVLPEVVSQISNVVDLEDYFNSDQEVGNWLSSLMTSMQDSVREATPIYRENPNKPLDISDSAYWFENGSSLVTSALGFVGTGYITGGVASTIFTKTGQASKWLTTLGKSTTLGNTGTNVVKGASALTTAVALNQAEGIGIAVDTYNTSYNNEYKRLRQDSNNINKSEEDLDKLARLKASKDAVSALNFNKVNILLNLTSASLFLKSPMSTRNILTKPSLLRTGRVMAREGAQEYAEEVINDISQQQALNKNYNAKDAIEYGLSEEGIEAGLLGFLGGAGQVALIKAGKHIPMYSNIAYNNAYREGYSKAQEDFSDEEKDAYAKKYAIAKVGTSKSRVSENFLQQQKYITQQEKLNEYRNLSSAEKINDLTSAFYSTDEKIKLLSDIEIARTNKDIAKVSTLEKKLFNIQAFEAFETGTTEKFIELYKGFEQLTHEEAEKKDLYKEGDETTEDYYKNRAKSLQKEIKDLENLYIESNSYINNKQVYDLESEKYYMNNSINKNLQEIEALFELAHKKYKNKPNILSDSRSYLDNTNPSGYNLKKTTPAFKRTKIYKEIKEKLNVDKQLRDATDSIESILDNITSKEFQSKLKDLIKTNKEKEIEQEKSKETKKKKVEKAKEINQKIEEVTTARNIQEVNTVEPVQEVNTVETINTLDTFTPVVVTEAELAEAELAELAEAELAKTSNANVNTSNNNKNFPSTVKTFNIPPFADPQIVNNLQEVKGVVENPNIYLEDSLPYLIDRLNAYKLNKNILLSSFPLEANNINSVIAQLEDIISTFQEDLNIRTIEQENLANLQQDFIQDLLEDKLNNNIENNSNIESSDSPASKPDFEKQQKRVASLISILEKMYNIGIDINDFKAVISSFQQNVGKAEILKVFDTLKYIYNLATDSTIEGSYESIMFSQEQREEYITKAKQVKQYYIPTDTYTSDLDNISLDTLELYKDMAKLNNLEVDNSGLSFDTYNNTASNKLAYLAKLYNINFTEKISKTGNPYIEVSKSDINNLLNSALDQKVLDPDFLVVGKEISFIPLKSVTLEDGTILDAADTTIDNAPIGIEVDGELVDGLYLHNVSWLNSTNLNATKEAIIEDQNTLRNLRSLILTSSTKITTKIIEKSPGIPILDASGEINTVLENTPNVKIGIIKDGLTYTGRESVIETSNVSKISDGKGVIVIPFGNSFLSLPVKRAKLNTTQIDSIINVIKLYLDGVKNDTTYSLDNSYNYNVLTMRGLESYLNNFISLSKLSVNSFEEFEDELLFIPDNVNILQFSNGKIYYGGGQGIDTNYLSRDKNEGEERDKDLNHLRSFLSNMYTHVNLDMLGSTAQIPFIDNEGAINTPYKDYNDFAKSNMISSYLSMTLDNGKEIYTIQSKFHFDMKSIFSPISNSTENINTQIDVNTVIADSSSIVLPNGKSFSFDNVTDEDFSLPVEDSTNDLNGDIDINSIIAKSSLIKGISILTQNSLVKSIANDIYSALLDNKNNAEYSLVLNKFVNLSLQGLDLIKNTAIQSNHPKADFISSQVEIIKDNKEKLIDNIKRELAKKVNINLIETFEDSNNETVFDEEEVNDKSIFNDLLHYTIDPKTTLTKEVKQFLEGVTDKKIVDTLEGKEYITRTNLLGLNNYISFDIVFNDLLSILSKSNFKSKDITSYLVSNKYKNVSPFIAQAIDNIEAELDSKPYLIDVVNRLLKAEPHVQNAFILALNKTHTNHIFLQATYNPSTKKYSIRPNKASSKSLTSLIISEWQNNLRYTSTLEVIDKKIVLNKEEINRFKNLYKTILVTPEVTYPLLEEWLSIIGISIPENLYKDLYVKGLKQNDIVIPFKSLFDNSNGLFKNIYNRVLKFDNEINKGLDLNNNNLFDDSSFKTLAQLTTRYRKNLFTDSFKNGNGDTVYGYTNSRYAIDRAIKLKSDKNLLSSLKANIFSSNSSWLNSLLTISENGVEINKNSLFYKYFEYGTSDSLKIRNNQLGKTIDKLNDRELELYNLGLFYNRGLSIGKGLNTIPIIRVVYPTMSDKANTFIVQVPGKYYNLTEEGLLRDSDKADLVKLLFSPEIERIKAFNANPNRVDIKEYKKGGGKFLLFPFLNTISELYNEDGTLKDDVGINPIYDEALTSALMGYLKNMYLEKLNLWKETNIIITDKNGVERLSYIDDNYSKTFNNPNYKEVLLNYIINTTVTNLNFQQLFISDPALYYKPSRFDKTDIDKAISTADNQGKRLAGDNAGKVEILNTPKDSFNLLIIKDNIVKSSNYDYIKSLLGEEKAKDYLEINAADAQEYTSLEEHLHIMYLNGELSLEKKNQIMEIYNKTGKVKKLDKKFILNPFKPVYVNNIQRDGIDSRLYVKSSSIPLIKEFTKGLPLDKLRDFMEKNNINRVAYESAVKVGLPSNVIDIFSGEDIVIPSNYEQSLLKNVPREGHGIQQPVPYDPDKSIVNDGTQQSKLLFTNLLDVNGFINPITGEENSGRELAQTYLNLYRQLFTLKFNKLIKELGFNPNTNTISNIVKLKKIIKDEGISRNYSKNDLDSLELNELGTKFIAPLWTSNVDNKIGALLSSIVDNRIRKRKFRGKSFVLVSNSGTKLDTVDSINTSDIVTFNNWDGELKSSTNKDGIITYSEVLIPFKAWDNEGKALSLKNFLNEDGTIDLARLPEELFEIFSYRIPTSGVNLISTIKVVGFLPESYGDKVITSPEFIVQMGSDFDVDKLYTHMYNTYYNSLTNSLSIITENTLINYNNLLKSINTISKEIKRLKYNLSSVQDNEIAKQLEEKLAFLKETDLYKLSDIEESLLQNQLLDIHKAVLNNPNEDVQKARVKPLSFGELPRLAIELKSTKDNKFFTPLSNAYQQFKYLNARAGKVAVGIFSLDMVFNSTLQFINKPVYFKELLGDNLIKKTYIIANQKSKNLNDIYTVTGKKYKSEVLEAFMTAALDNEKEQLLGKLNINNHTFDFIRAMTQMGYEEDTTISIINQPIIKKYIKDKMLGVPTVLPIILTSKELSIIESFEIDYLKSIVNKPFESLTKEEVEVQNIILSLFLEISKKGEQLKIVQSAINSDSSGIGKNLFYSTLKSRQILSLPNMNDSIENISDLIGDYVVNTSEADTIGLKNNNYLLYNGVWIKPNSLGGFAGVYATLFNTQLWQNFYPYFNAKLLNTLEVISSFAGNNTTLNDKAKNLQNAVSEYKSFLISSTYKLFSNYSNIKEARKDLLFDSLNHLSLGSIISDLRKNNIYTNALLDRLQIGKTNKNIDITSSIPTNLSYYTANTLELDDEIVLNSFIEMLSDNKSIGIYNNQELSPKLLAEKLITHQIITGGIQKSGQFIKHIPFEYLKQKGYFNYIESLNDMIINSNNSFLQNLIIQYVQHNPELLYSPLVEEQYTIVGNSIIPNNSDVSLRNIVVMSADPVFRIFLKTNQNIYKEIDILGQDGIAEYDFEADLDADSTIYINKKAEASAFTIEYVPDFSETAKFLSLNNKENIKGLYNPDNIKLIDKYFLNEPNMSIENKYQNILEKIKDTNSNPITAHFADKLLDLVPYLSSTPIYIDTKLKTQGTTYTSNIKGEPLQIRINPNYIKTEAELQDVLIEEIIHSVLKANLKDNNNPFTKSLNNIKDEVTKRAIARFGLESFETMVDKVSKKLPLKEGVERDIMYNLYSIDEFVAGAIKNKTFQEFLNDTESLTVNKTLWERIVDSIKKLLIALGVKQDSTLGAVLNETLQQFKVIDTNLAKQLTTPKYYRTAEYINKRFNLLDSNSQPIPKGNSVQIADFINNNIINLEAKVVDDTVIVSSTKYKEIIEDYQPFLDFSVTEETSLGSNLKNYIQNLTIRKNKLLNSIKNAKQDENFERVAVLNNRLEKENSKLEGIKAISSLVELADKAEQDLQMVGDLLKQPLSSEDIVYVRSIINFWKKAKEMVFDERANSSDALARLYGGVESLAERKSDELFKIEKANIQSFIKEYNNVDTDIDTIFENYKDINIIQGNVRDISNYDNILLDTIWKAIKTANIEASEESNKLLGDLDVQLKEVLPILKSINPDNPFDIFRQRTERGKLTGHIVNPYTNVFYKDKYKNLNNLNDSKTFESLIKYTNWIKNNGEDFNLESIFPISNNITDEVENNRNTLKEKVGEGVYDIWFNNQQRKLDLYNKSKDGYINLLIREFQLNDKNEIPNNKEALSKYNYWIERHSPYKLDNFIFNRAKLAANSSKYYSQDYYEVLPNKEVYLENNFTTISQNPTLYTFYKTIDNIFKDLKQYVPDNQQKALAYGGLPFIEKTILELYQDKGLKLGITPVYDAFVKSMQTNYSDSAFSVIDPVTGKPQKEMYIPMIKDNYRQIQEYVNLQVSKYIVENNTTPSEDIIKEFEEDAIDFISEQKSFDLGRIVKVYSSLVLGYKHKNKIEDSIKIANTILDGYKETIYRPDGTPEIDLVSRVIQKKDTSDSFIKTKQSLENYLNNVLYGDVKDEEGKLFKGLTKTDKIKKAELARLLTQLDIQKEENLIDEDLYANTKASLDKQMDNLGKTIITSKVGDNILKYVQLKLMGWNVLGGISNSGFGFFSNLIESAGKQVFTTKDLLSAYSLTLNSIGKNLTFNQIETPIAKKIRSAMDKWDVLKDASNELYKSDTNDFSEKLKAFKPYNMNQRTEYLNQAPLLIALLKNTKVPVGEDSISLWEGYDNDFNWRTEYGEEPKDVINKTRLKLDQIIKRTHGNYDNLSPLAIKRTFLGRAISQFRTWLYESIAVRVEAERYDSVLEQTVKGRYRSVGTVYNNTNIGAFSLETLKNLIRQMSFNTIFKGADFSNLKSDKIKDVDVANMRKVIMETVLAIDVYLFLLLLHSLMGDDDDNKTANILFNQGARLKTDLLLYVNPMEARNIIRDIIPSVSVVKDTADWVDSIGAFVTGNDTYQSGVHAGDSRLLNSSIKMIPFGSKVYSTYNSASQVFDK